MSLFAFDGLARDYDLKFTESAVGRILREVVWTRLQETFRPCRTVLELGCGTGEDAIWLARRGIRVLASDAAASMIEVARRKAQAAGCAEQIEFRCFPMERVRAELEDRSFDGVFSDFGALNCVRDLSSLVAQVSTLVRPGGRLFWVLMGKHVPWEWAWYLSRGEWRRAWRRTRSEGASWRGISVVYPTPREMIRRLHPAFQVSRLTPLGFALPPSYAAAWLDRSPRCLAMLARLEAAGRRASFLAALADHYVVEATRA